MIDIVDGIGRSVLCEWCNHPLTLDSRTNYEKCFNCGGKYNDPMKTKVEFKSFKNWYYYVSLFKLLFKWV